ncbi:hypothetical protein DL95DRAFT_418080 [Leptodontidium sp. 2 PMI_412]|nr:hypothetical protein DL95DRAFT_418080 [Leptodontidium sp. 2 PMI_412]
MDVELEAFRREEIEELRNASITEIDLPNRAARTDGSSASPSTAQFRAPQQRGWSLWTITKALCLGTPRFVCSGIAILSNVGWILVMIKKLYSSAKKYRVQLLKSLGLLTTIALAGVSLYYQWLSVKLAQIQVMLALKPICTASSESGDCRVQWEPLCIQYFGRPKEPCNVMGYTGPWFPIALEGCIKSRIFLPRSLQALALSVNYFYGTPGSVALIFGATCLFALVLSKRKWIQQSAILLFSAICIIVIGTRCLPTYQGRLVAFCASSVLNTTAPRVSGSFRSQLNTLSEHGQYIRGLENLVRINI